MALESITDRCSCGAALISAPPWLRCLVCGRTWTGEFSHAVIPVECPCCGWISEVFLPLGIRKKPNRRCGRCGSLERQRYVHFYLRMETQLLDRPMSMLHVAPEWSLTRWLRQLPSLRHISTDLYSPRAGVRADLCQLPFRNEAFDLVLASHVIEHISDDRAAFRQLHRVLKPGGFALLLYPSRRDQLTYEDFSITSEEGRRKHFGQHDHVRWIGYDYPERIRDAGFGFDIIQADSLLTPAAMVQFGIDPIERVYRCDKVNM